MTHHRNFYFEKVTTGPAVRGGNEQPSRSIASGQRETNSMADDVAATFLPDYAGGKDSHRQLFLGDERELGAICLVIGLALIPALFVFSLLFFWFALIG